MKKETIKKRLDKLLRAKCQGCGGCCTNSVVPVTHADIKRLIKKTKLSAKKIARFVDEDEIDFDEDAPNWIQLKGGKRAMALRKAEGRCMFLDEENRCTVYTARPATCRTFPIAIDLDEDDKVERVSLNRMIKDRYPLGKKRPLKDLIKDAKREDREDQKFYELIEEWNEDYAGKSAKSFLKFVKLA